MFLKIVNTDDRVWSIRLEVRLEAGHLYKTARREGVSPPVPPCPHARWLSQRALADAAGDDDVDDVDDDVDDVRDLMTPWILAGDLNVDEWPRSADAHAVLEAQVDQYMQRLSEEAHGGQWLEGRGFTPPEIQLAAQDLLATLYSDKNGYAIKTREQVFRVMAEPIRRRQAYINAVATSRGVSQPAAKGDSYTVQEWIEWLSERHDECCLAMET